MKKYFFLIFFTFNFVFANCYMGQWTDEMTDELNYIIRCEELDNDIAIALLPKDKKLKIQEHRMSILVDFLNEEKIFVEPNEDIRELQTIEVRVDKNKFFRPKISIYEDGGLIIFDLNKEQQKQIIDGKNLLLRYWDSKKMVKTQKIDISDLKKFK